MSFSHVFNEMTEHIDKILIIINFYISITHEQQLNVTMSKCKRSRRESIFAL